MRTIIFSVAAMFALQSTAQASQQLAPPGPDWRPFNASGSGVVASYNLPDQHGDSAHSVVAIVSSNYTSLDDFVQRNRALLKRTPGLSVLSERRVQACGGSAYEVTYRRERPSVAGIYDAVTMFERGNTYIAIPLRTAAAGERREATSWIHHFCKRAP